jgi:hypothetical protein
VRLNKIKNKYLVLDILCFSHRTSRSFSLSLHRTSKTFRNFSRSEDVYLYFRANPWRERLIFDKYGPPFPLDPGMPDKDLCFWIYSNRELLSALSIAVKHSHLVTINMYFAIWEGGEPVSKECLDLIKTLKHVEINVISSF